MRQEAIRESVIGQIIPKCRACAGDTFMDIGVNRPFIEKGDNRPIGRLLGRHDFNIRDGRP